MRSGNGKSCRESLSTASSYSTVSTVSPIHTQKRRETERGKVCRSVVGCSEHMSSQKRLNRVSLSHILRQLKMCGWYWGDLSSEEAEEVLKNTQDGSFILRDSADACHLFTLSLKAEDLVVSVRVAFSRGQFKLDSLRQEDSPGFESMIDLVDYYLADRRRKFFVAVPDMKEFAVSLLHPVWKEVPTLQHLCRRCIVQPCRSADQLESLPLPPHLIRFLKEYAPVDYSRTQSQPSSPSHSSLSTNHRRPV